MSALKALNTVSGERVVGRVPFIQLSPSALRGVGGGGGGFHLRWLFIKFPFMSGIGGAAAPRGGGGGEITLSDDG